MSNATGQKSNVQYEPVIGIECHVQLKTRSKLFCGCDNDARDKAPNTTVCPVCLGLPGTLPVLNKRAVELAIRAGLALNGQIARQTKFDRKNYFYPDLPKGYQITQFDQPIVGPGQVAVPMGDTALTVRITRAHLEEDAGKLTHPAGVNYSLVDLNRAGTPLLEIVSEPDMHSPAQAKAYAQELYNLMRYADVSDVDLYYGNMRFDVNVSLRPAGSQALGIRTETKNLNSFRAVERAVEYEIQRQTELLNKGDRVVQETRGWDEAKGKTFSQRSKEEAHDYRYFPEPDLPPLLITQKLIDAVKAELPPLPPQIRTKLTEAGVQASEIETLIANPELLVLYEAAAGHKPTRLQVKTIVNWLVGPVQSEIMATGYDTGGVAEDARMLLEFAGAVEAGDISQTAAKDGLIQLLKSKSYDETDIRQAIQSRRQISDTSQLDKIIADVIAAHPKPVADYRAGQQQARGFLVGQVMKASGGQANPQLVNELLLKALEEQL